MITDASDAFCKMSGYTKGELLGKPHNIIRDPDMPKSAFRDMWSTIQSGKAWSGQVKNRKKDDGFYWVYANIEPIYNRKGEVEAYIAIRLDTTDKMALEEEIAKNKKQHIALLEQTQLANSRLEDLTSLNEKLEKAKKKAEDNTQSKSKFLANMSHEIRTPMNGILGMTHLVLQTDLSQQQQKYIKNIDYSAKSLLGIINDILDFSKIEAGKMDIVNIDFDLYEMVDNVVNIVKFRADEKGLKLSIDYDTNGKRYLFGDRLRIAQVITNLLGNAIKFTSSGEVSVDIKYIKKGRYLFSISDTGIGLKEEQKSKLFHSFTQADESTSREYGGTGLGLSISKQLVELMGGEIWVESEFGVGSRFCFEIPLAEIESSRVMESAVDDNGVNIKNDITTLNGSKILLVEDNQINQEIITGMLEDSGIEIDIANNGQEAIERYESGKYEMILTDIHMPIMDGYAFATKVRETDRDTPIIALTANVMQEDILKIESVGMDDYIGKPVDIGRLYEILVKYISLKVEQGNTQESGEEISIPNFISICTATGLSHMSGDKELYLKVLRKFRDNYRDLDLNTIQDEEYNITLHTIIGLSETIGAIELSTISKELKEAKDKTLISKFQNELASVIGELMELD